MVKLFEKRPVSNHIQIAAFPAKKEKGEVCVFGRLIGFSDYNTDEGSPGSVNIGKQASVFQAARTALTGTVNIGTDVFVTPAEVLSTTATGNLLLGTVVAIGSDTFDIAVVG